MTSSHGVNDADNYDDDEDCDDSDGGYGNGSDDDDAADVGGAEYEMRPTLLVLR